MLEFITGRIRDVRTLTRLFEAAEQAAARDGLDVPGPEHVVVGALSLEEDSAARALAGAGIDPDTLEAAIRRAHGAVLGLEEDDGPVASPPRPRATPARMTGAGEGFLKKLHAVHVEEGGRLRGALVVLAAAELTAGVWPRVLASAGVSPQALRDAARRELA